MILSKRTNGIYYVYFLQQNGKRTCATTHTRIKAEALKFVTNFEKEMEERKRNKLIPVSLSDFKKEYLVHSQTIHTKNTSKVIRVSFKFFESYFRKITLPELNKSNLTDYFQNRISTASIYQARIDRINLSSAFSYAVDKKYLASNPMKEIKPFKIPEKQPLFFSEAEFQILLNATIDKDLKDLFIVAVNTGLRQMEILTLTWQQINFRQNMIMLDNQQHLSKSKKSSSVPLNLTALQILTERELHKTSEYVFTYHNKQMQPDFVSHQFKQIVRSARLNDSFSFHTLRHTFASWLVQRNVPIQQVQQLLRHADLKTSLIYAHLRNDNLSTSVNLLN
ncbi:MAG: site-specific integrase [Ignavibacteriaceae bacterium]|jgi:integrase|nr:site-specific integrase [Ignavibacteriaceae bacterium]